LEKSTIYIQHVEGTAFTKKQMITENKWWISKWKGIYLW